MFQEICRWLVTPQAQPHVLYPADISELNKLNTDEKRCYHKLVSDVMSNFSNRKDSSPIHYRDTYGIIFRYSLSWTPEIEILKTVASEKGSTIPIRVSTQLATKLLEKIKTLNDLQEKLLIAKAELNQLSNLPPNQMYKEKEQQIWTLKEQIKDDLIQTKKTIDLGLDPFSKVSTHVQSNPVLHSLLYRFNEHWTQYILFFNNNISLADEKLCVEIVPTRKHISTAKKVDFLQRELSKPTVKAIFFVQEVIENNIFLVNQLESGFAADKNQQSTHPLKVQRSSSSHVVTGEFYIDDYFHVEDAPPKIHLKGSPKLMKKSKTSSISL